MRYDGRILMINDSELYDEQFFKRRVFGVKQYATSIIRYPTVEEMSEFLVISHVWSLGDRFYKLSDKHYGNVDFWWVIPWFNQKPLESDFRLGDTINIPKPLELALTYFNIG